MVIWGDEVAVVAPAVGRPWSGRCHEGGVADLMGSGSNQLSDMLMEWSAVLKHSSLGCPQAENNNDRKDGRAPRDSHPAVGRRRKTA